MYTRSSIQFMATGLILGHFDCLLTSPHSVRDPDSEMREIFVLGNSESRKILLEKSGILGSGIWSKVQRIRNPSNEWNPESKFHWQRLGSSTWYPQFTTWNPESKTVLDSLSWDEWLSTFIKILRKCEDTYLVQNPKIFVATVFRASAQKWPLGSINNRNDQG